MRIKRINEATGFRSPTQSEINGVSKHMKAYYQANSKISEIAGIILATLGLLLINGSGDGNSFLTLILGGGSLAGAVMALYNTFTNKQKAVRFEKGEFYVLEGTVTNIQMAPEMPGVSSVEFTSNWGQTLDGRFEVRHEELQIGTPLLLVYIPKKEGKITGDFQWAFTPFMLTEEGIRRHRL